MLNQSHPSLSAVGNMVFMNLCPDEDLTVSALCTQALLPSGTGKISKALSCKTDKRAKGSYGGGRSSELSRVKCSFVSGQNETQFRPRTGLEFV